LDPIRGRAAWEEKMAYLRQKGSSFFKHCRWLLRLEARAETTSARHAGNSAASDGSLSLRPKSRGSKPRISGCVKENATAGPQKRSP
jgi:hypothetical protein